MSAGLRRGVDRHGGAAGAAAALMGRAHQPLDAERSEVVGSSSGL